MSLLHLYRRPAFSTAKKNELLSIIQQKISPEIKDIETEYCFNIEATSPLIDEELNLLRCLRAETCEPENFSSESFLDNPPLPPFTKGGLGGLSDQNIHPSSLVSHPFILEVGPRMNFTTAWSTHAVSVCHACGLKKIRRIERSRRYKLIRSQKSEVRSQQSNPLLPPFSKGGHGGITFNLQPFLELIHDRMTECPYPERLTTFETGIKPEPVCIVPLIEEGKEALRKINTGMGLGLDDWDIEYY